MESQQDSGAKKVRLFEERGETSRFVDAEITASGDLVVSCQDVGKAPLEWWGDSDYEFWVTVSNKDKQRVFHALMEHGRKLGISSITSLEDQDIALLTLMSQLYGGHFHAVDEFRDFLGSRGITCSGGTWM